MFKNPQVWLGLIPVLTPILIWAGKRLADWLVVRIPKVWFPIVAPIIGGVLDAIMQGAILGGESSPVLGAVLGALGVFVRELIDQLKKAWTGGAAMIALLPLAGKLIANTLLLLIVAGFLAGAACEARPTPESVKIQSGKIIAAAAQQFLSTAALYDRLLDEKLITPAEYRPWAAFVPRFQKAYTTAYAAWVIMPDNATTFDTKALSAMVDELLIMYLKIKAKSGGGG